MPKSLRENSTHDVCQVLCRHAAAAAAAAKSLKPCLTLCDPIDSSPPGSSVQRILQARILEWVAISFSDRIRSRILFIYLFRLCWVFVVACRLSLVAVSVGSSLQWLFLQSTGSRHTGSVLVVHGLSCPVACGIFPTRESN